MAYVSLYVSTFRIALNVDPADKNSWSRMYGSLSCLRESIVCHICRKLALKPVRPLPPNCPHNICKRCIGSKAQKKSYCKFCSELKEYEENVNLRIILKCYKRMCKFLLSSNLFSSWRGANLSTPMRRFVSLLYEGAELADNYKSKFSNESLNDCLTSVLSNNDENNQSINGQRNVFGMEVNDSESAKILLNNTLKECMLLNSTDSDESSDTSGFDVPTVINECFRSEKKWESCRCGMATRNPGRLTCRGQRCPCYVGGRPCIACPCRGCRNPEKNLVLSPVHSFHSMNVASPGPSYFDFESNVDTTSSDSDQDPSV